MEIRYYGDKISQRIAKTPEGFLICQDVPISRTGYQSYLASEIEENPKDKHKVLHVYRPACEVFNEKSLASFEGKPVTNEHPQEDVTPGNFKKYSCGHVQNVHVGIGKDSNKVLADLYITDPVLIQLIKDGKREISCGYYAEEKKDSEGRLCQTKIRGNHVAVVNSGRAGKTVCIRDHNAMESSSRTGRGHGSSVMDYLLSPYNSCGLGRNPLEKENSMRRHLYDSYLYDDDDELIGMEDDDELEDFEDDDELEEIEDDDEFEEIEDDDEDDVFEDDDDEFEEVEDDDELIDIEDDDELEDFEDDDEDIFEDACYRDIDLAAVGGAIKKGAGAAAGAAKKAGGAIASGAKKAGGAIASGAKKAGSAIQKGAKSAYNTVKKKGGELLRSAKTQGKNALNTAKSAGKKAVTWAKNNPGKTAAIAGGAGLAAGVAAGRASKDSLFGYNPYYDYNPYFDDDELLEEIEDDDEIILEDDDMDGESIEEKADMILEDAKRTLRKAKKKLSGSRKARRRKKDAIILSDDDDELDEIEDDDELEEEDVEVDDDFYGRQFSEDDGEESDESESIDPDKTKALREITEASRGISDPHERKNVQDAIYKALCGKNQMADVVRYTMNNNRAHMDSLFGTRGKMSIEGQQAIYDSFNPHKN